MFTAIGCGAMCLPALLVANLLQAGPTQPSAESDRQKVAAGNTTFALNLYGQLREQPGNLFFCPFSVSTALAMTSVGARAETARQMAAVLHSKLEPARQHAAFEELLRLLETSAQAPGWELHLANALWAHREYAFLPEFIAICQKHYQAAVQTVDFVGALEQARQTINRWVSERTAGKIKELVPAGVLDLTTRLVLTNATYFKGQWATRFDPQKTADDTFRRADLREIPVRMMHQTGTFGYLELPGCQLLELRYAGEALSMVILLPPAPDGLPTLENSLDAARLSDWLSRLEPRQVQVSLPKFALSSQFRLDRALRALGMTDAFDPSRADFSGMDGTRNLYIGAVLHQAFIEVNEEGTEAAGATAVVMKIRAGPQERIPIFRADHPFLFLIRDLRTDTMLFLGRLADPQH
jgi:serpin B